MKEKALWAAVAALALLSAGQAYYIFTRPTAVQEKAVEDNTAAAARVEATKPQAQTPDPWKELEEWRRGVDARLRRGDPLRHRDFDAFFNDDFFGRRFSPFDQMERIHRQMLDAFTGSQRGTFGDSWDSWFNDRMGMEAFRTNIARTDKNVTIAIDIPGVDDKTADININEDRIRISFTTKNVQDKKDEKGAVHQESSRSYTKIMPVPEDAVAASAKTSIANGKVTITFDRKGK